MMVSDINKFNDVECRQRNEKISATHNYKEFNQQMQKRMKEQQNAMRKAIESPNSPILNIPPVRD